MIRNSVTTNVRLGNRDCGVIDDRILRDDARRPFVVDSSLATFIVYLGMNMKQYGNAGRNFSIFWFTVRRSVHVDSSFVDTEIGKNTSRGWQRCCEESASMTKAENHKISLLKKNL